MKLTNILKVFLLGLAFLAFAGCEKAPEVNQPETELTDVTITLGIDKTTLESAQVRVRHNGSESVRWVYMLTSDFETDASKLLSDKLAKDLEIYAEIMVYSGQNKSLRLSDLEPKTEYRFICAVLDPATGLPYGDIAEITFKTRRDPSVFNLNDNWTVSMGERYINPLDQMEYDVFNCASTDEETYLLVPIKVSDFESYYGNDVRAMFEDYIAALNLPVGDRQWKDLVVKGTKEISEQRLRSGDWCIFMVGVADNGELSGYYQRLDVTVEPEEPSEGYLKWTGEWQISTADGTDLFTISVIPSENNMWYYVAGWESDNIYGYDTSDFTLMFETFYDKTSERMVFVSQYVNTVLGSDNMDFYFSASFLYGSSTYVVPKEVINQKLAEVMFVDPTCSKAKISGLTFSVNGMDFMLSEICYMYYVGTGSNPASISLDAPDLPLTMTKITE